MYRKLTDAEISRLEAQLCEADCWDDIEVAEDFRADHVRRVAFKGSVRLGAFRRTYREPGGFESHSGLYDCRLCNVTVGDDCYIGQVRNYIANCDIENDVFIENTNLIVVDGETTFGNGVRVAVMNEGGGRQVPIFNRLSAQLAYILTLYRHNERLISTIESMIDAYALSLRSSRGRICHDVKIINCGTFKNVHIGPHATLIGVSKLSNGSVNSNAAAPVHVGSGVKCDNFILCSGVEVSDSTLISNCFIGQGTIMGKHYSAIDSLFFSNCQGFHGEATAIFAGPYTVTHHKSTLLIAGMFSFLNAGSGSNQSNHMYKLGPIHQGLVERGSKTTSDSYLLWPARIGAFTLVMGRHTDHPDTSDLPFSYLIENNTESFLVPAVNIRSVGTVRDAQKWPQRDNRLDPDHLDKINFNLLSPYTVQKMLRGHDTLRSIEQISGPHNNLYIYNNCKIRRSSLCNGLRLYDMAIKKFMGNSLISRIRKSRPATFAELLASLEPTTRHGRGEWVDIAGLIAPQSLIDDIIGDVVGGRSSLDDIERRFTEAYDNYYDYEWTWAVSIAEERMGIRVPEITREVVIENIEEWLRSVVELDKMLYADARKEFDKFTKIGFGVDGDDDVRRKDFEAVRGSFDNNSFVRATLNHIEEKTRLGQETLDLVRSLK